MMRRCRIILLISLVLAQFAVGLELKLTYPRDLNQSGELIVPPVDSLFALGQVSADCNLLQLNGETVLLQSGGRWLHWLAGDDSLQFRLTGSEGSTAVSYPLGQADPVSKTELAPADFIVVDRIGCSLKSAVHGTYFAFPQPGTRFPVIDTDEQLYHVGFGNRREGWIRPVYAGPVAYGLPAPDVIHSLRVESTEQGLTLRLQATKQLVLEQLSPDCRQLKLTFTNAISDIDIIEYPADLTEWFLVDWQQPGEREVELTLSLELEKILGYRLQWEDDECLIQLRLASRFAGSFWNLFRPGRGWTVMLDPGHGGTQQGAIGPAGLMEKEVNLQLALMLREKLERKGFNVVLTREDDREVGLAQRVALALEADATLFLSLHYNSTAQGTDPRELRGTSLYWYYPQSAGLARTLRPELLKQLQLGDDGFYYRNLAVLRNSWMPAVLVEGGYIIQPETEALLEQSNLLEREASAITNGIVRYRKELR